MSDTQEGFNPEWAKYDTLSPIELIKAMATVQSRKERGEAVMKEINAEFDFLRLVKIPAVFEEQEIKNMTVDEIGRCQLAADIHAGIVGGKKDEAYQWLRDNGFESLIQESVNASTLKASLKAALKKGEPWPEELFRVSPFTRASIVKA
ncbi:MAG: hypothetical protein E6R08_06520 [Nevskiaceae bacterium]|nr:MAG: hypothetical protein E6R08_06520 [Nevskiaceae bacterium]